MTPDDAARAEPSATKDQERRSRGRPSPTQRRLLSGIQASTAKALPVARRHIVQWQ